MRRLLFLALLLPATAAGAQEAERFQLERTESGYVRLDTQTGAMSVCEEQGDALVCRPATDERQALAGEPDALRARIEALERRVAALESGKGGEGLPSDAELDRTLSFMERFFRTFMGLAREWSEDEPPPPNRTQL